MAKKPIHDLSQLGHLSSGGLVYSTETGRIEATEPEPDVPTLPPAQQDLRITLDKRLKGGKQATVVYRFEGRTEDLEALGKRLKTVCSVGGTVKDGEIILQGNVLDRVQAELKKLGYRFKLAGV